MTVEFSASELFSIARSINDNHPDEPGEYEVEFKGFDIVLFYEAQYREGIGGSYEGYQFERIAELVSEYISVKGVYDSTGDEVQGAAKQIQNVLN